MELTITPPTRSPSEGKGGEPSTPRAVTALQLITKPTDALTEDDLKGFDGMIDSFAMGDIVQHKDKIAKVCPLKDLTTAFIGRHVSIARQVSNRFIQAAALGTVVYWAYDSEQNNKWFADAPPIRGTIAAGIAVSSFAVALIWGVNWNHSTKMKEDQAKRCKDLRAQYKTFAEYLIIKSILDPSFGQKVNRINANFTQLKAILKEKLSLDTDQEVNLITSYLEASLALITKQQIAKGTESAEYLELQKNYGRHERDLATLTHKETEHGKKTEQQQRENAALQLATSQTKAVGIMLEQMTRWGEAMQAKMEENNAQMELMQKELKKNAKVKAETETLKQKQTEQTAQITQLKAENSASTAEMGKLKQKQTEQTAQITKLKAENSALAAEIAAQNTLLESYQRDTRRALFDTDTMRLEVERVHKRQELVFELVGDQVKIQHEESQARVASLKSRMESRRNTPTRNGSHSKEPEKSPVKASASAPATPMKAPATASASEPVTPLPAK